MGKWGHGHGSETRPRGSGFRGRGVPDGERAAGTAGHDTPGKAADSGSDEQTLEQRRPDRGRNGRPARRGVGWARPQSRQCRTKYGVNPTDAHVAAGNTTRLQERRGAGAAFAPACHVGTSICTWCNGRSGTGLIAFLRGSRGVVRGLVIVIVGACTCMARKGLTGTARVGASEVRRVQAAAEREVHHRGKHRDERSGGTHEGTSPA